MTDQPVKPVVKATKSEVKKRISKIADLLVSGLTRAQILQYVVEKTDWNLKDRQVDTYIQRANNSFKATPGIDRTQQYQRAIRRMEMILSACIKVQDFARAIAAAKELHTLMAIYEPPAAQTIITQDMGALVKLAKAKGISLTELIRDLTSVLMEVDPDE